MTNLDFQVQVSSFLGELERTLKLYDCLIASESDFTRVVAFKAARDAVRYLLESYKIYFRL